MIITSNNIFIFFCRSASAGTHALGDMSDFEDEEDQLQTKPGPKIMDEGI